MSAPNLTVSIPMNSTGDGLLFSDTTAYSAGTILSSTVTSVNLKLDYSTLGTSIRYTFTVSSNVITAAHLILLDGSSTNILSQISTAFPFVDFDMTADYGTTIPAVEDGIYVATYEILGTSGSPYDYTAVQEQIVSCSACCCISSMFQKLNPEACLMPIKKFHHILPRPTH